MYFPLSWPLVFLHGVLSSCYVRELCNVDYFPLFLSLNMTKTFPYPTYNHKSIHLLLCYSCDRASVSLPLSSVYGYKIFDRLSINCQGYLLYIDFLSTSMPKGSICRNKCTKYMNSEGHCSTRSPMLSLEGNNISFDFPRHQNLIQILSNLKLLPSPKTTS